MKAHCDNLPRSLTFNLDEPVDREPPDDDVAREFDHVEETEHDPVSQPLGVVILCRRLDRFDSEINVSMGVSKFR